MTWFAMQSHCCVDLVFFCCARFWLGLDRNGENIEVVAILVFSMGWVHGAIPVD